MKNREKLIGFIMLLFICTLISCEKSNLELGNDGVITCAVTIPANKDGSDDNPPIIIKGFAYDTTYSQVIGVEIALTVLGDTLTYATDVTDIEGFRFEVPDSSYVLSTADPRVVKIEILD